VVIRIFKRKLIARLIVAVQLGALLQQRIEVIETVGGDGSDHDLNQVFSAVVAGS